MVVIGSQSCVAVLGPSRVHGEIVSQPLPPALVVVFLVHSMWRSCSGRKLFLGYRALVCARGVLGSGSSCVAALSRRRGCCPEVLGYVSGSVGMSRFPSPLLPLPRVSRFLGALYSQPPPLRENLSFSGVLPNLSVLFLLVYKSIL